MSEILSNVKEYITLNQELKNRNKETVALRKRKIAISESILRYLEESGKPGVKYNNIVILAKDIKRRTPKKKEVKAADISAVLASRGIEVSEEMVAEMFEAIKGIEIERKCLKITKIEQS